MARFAAIQKESIFGTKPSPWSPTFLDLISESVNPNRGYIKVETGSSRVPRWRIPGGFKETGDLEMVAIADDVSSIIEAILGDADSSTLLETGAWEHIWTPPNDAIDSFSVEISPSIGTESRLCLGTAFKSLTIDCPAREKVGFTPTLLVSKEVIQNVTAPPISFSSVRPFIFFENSVKVADKETFIVESLSITMENDIPEDTFAQGSMFLPEIVLQGFTLSGTMDIRMKDWELHKRFYGSETATEPSTEPETLSLVTDIQGVLAGATKKFQLKIDIPAIQFDESGASFDRRERMVYSLPWEAVLDDTGKIATVTVVNAKSAP